MLGAEPNALLYQGPVWHSQCYWAKPLPQLSSWKMLANPGEYLSAFCAWFIIRRRRDPPQCRHMLQSLQFQKETSATTCATTFVHSALVLFPHSRKKKKKAFPLIRLLVIFTLRVKLDSVTTLETIKADFLGSEFVLRSKGGIKKKKKEKL